VDMEYQGAVKDYEQMVLAQVLMEIRNPGGVIWHTKEELLFRLVGSLFQSEKRRWRNCFEVGQEEEKYLGPVFSHWKGYLKSNEIKLFLDCNGLEFIPV